MRPDAETLRHGYDAVAEDYTREFCDEMQRKPFDCRMLDWLIDKAAGLGPICDLGCGPGQIARYLHSRGAASCGIDLSSEMVVHARRCNPDIPFEQGDMLALDRVGSASFGGIAAFYSIIHIGPEDAARAFSEIRRVLQPGGVILLAFHLGDEVLRKEEWWDKPVSIDFFFYRTAQVRGWLTTSGLQVEEAIERDPYPPGIEFQSRRAYIFARKPSGIQQG
jgi:SAM-dependent methyltransferase